MSVLSGMLNFLTAWLFPKSLLCTVRHAIFKSAGEYFWHTSPWHDGVSGALCFAAVNAEPSLSHAEKPVVTAVPAVHQDHMKDEDNAS